MASPLPRGVKPPHTLSQDLKRAVEAASIRASEGQLIFGPLTELWDNYMSSDEVRKLPARLRKPLAVLCTEITSTANRHFDAYIKGDLPITRALPALLAPHKPISAAHQPLPISATQPRSAATTCTQAPSTYAQAAASQASIQPETTTIASKPITKNKPTIRPETRLFVRNPSELARAAGSFAVFTSLRKELGPKGHLLTEVQETKSGLALCTKSPQDLLELESCTPELKALFPGCQIEKQEPWITYRLNNVPRSVRLLNEVNELTNRTVTPEELADAIQQATNQYPTRVTETLSSIESRLYNSSWTVHFLAVNHRPVPRTLRILGATISAHTFTIKPKTVQCTRCFFWHNTRSCARAQHCRLCGSQNHIETTHTSKCNTKGPHTCPARCIHCGGPHAADFPQCPLRPIHKVLKTKEQSIATRKIGKAARKRAEAAALCTRISIPDTLMEEELITPTLSPTIPTTPTGRISPAILAISGPATRFISLNLEEHIPRPDFNA